MVNLVGVGCFCEFELGDVVCDVMDVFWDCGYEGVFLFDLIVGIGLLCGSFYKVFGDKKVLLLVVFDLYMVDGFKVIVDILL